MRDGWPCLRLLQVVVVLSLLCYPRGSRAMAPEFQHTLVVPADAEIAHIHEVRRPQERHLRERIIADAVANAFADVIREKAGDTATSGKTKAAQKQSKVAPSTTPMNTKEFAYTNIKFKSFVNDDASDKKDDGFIQSLQETAMQKAVQHQQEEEKKTPQVPHDDTEDLEAQLNAKLAAIQRR